MTNFMPIHWSASLALAWAVAAFSPVAAFGQTGELPYAPILPSPPKAAIEKNFGTQATPASVAIRPDMSIAGSTAKLKSGLEALSAGEIGEVREVRDSLPERSLDRHILTWAIAYWRG